MSIFMSRDKKRKAAPRTQEHIETIGSNVSFAAKEAYKLLRTNLSYILSGDEAGACRIIGVTSSLRGEGKSTTSINLTYVLAEMNRRVLLIEGDLRLPTLQKKLKKTVEQGLSGILAGTADFEDCRQSVETVTASDEVVRFDILTAGEIPPNPSELLGSGRMKALMNRLAGQYDYIVLDLPPVTAVTDALIATKIVDGLIIVVRNNYTDRSSLNETLRQIQLVNGRILGFVMTCANAAKGAYGRKYRYRYYKREYK